MKLQPLFCFSGGRLPASDRQYEARQEAAQVQVDVSPRLTERGHRGVTLSIKGWGRVFF